jgi:signal transduction histidine kinase
VLPALLALSLVAAIAIQSVRAVQVHRRAVDLALRDYAAFATWQYTRRASDYLRLSIVASLADGGTRTSPGIVGRRMAFGVVRDAGIQIRENETGTSEAALADAFAIALQQTRRSHIPFGIASLGRPEEHRFLGYAIHGDSTGNPVAIRGIAIEPRDLVPILNHVASFAPLLPPSFVGRLPNDSLVSIQVLGLDGMPIARLGRDVQGIMSKDTLGPDLAGVRVVATLHPVATQRLVAGGMPSSNIPALVAMLAVTLVLCAVAVLQLRRTQELIRLRSDFVASVSHELKTPLAQISLFAETLASPRERSLSERRQYLTIISREAKRLGQLVDGILHFAGMLRGSASAGSRDMLVLADEIGAAVAAFTPIADARQVQVSVSVDERIELPLERDAFRQLMLNLLDNALKFGPDGQHVRVAAVERDGEAIITVDDEGAGIRPADRLRVFDPYVRVDTVGSRGGSGIGLAVVRDVARRHGGDASAAESPNGGARIDIRLPGARLVTDPVLETRP